MDIADNDYRSALSAAVVQVADLIAPVVDFTIPALGVWDLAGLVGHFLRAVRTPLSYLGEPEPAGSVLPGAAHYVAAYLDRRDTDPAAVDESVAARGTSEIAGDLHHPREVLLEEASRLDAALSTTPPDRLIGTPFGALRLGDYLRTRSLEIVVHGGDIARALGTTWSPPQTLVADALSLLGEVSLLRGSALDLVGALTGRIDPGNVLPVLR